MPDRQNVVMFLAGPKGQGKSTLTREIIRTYSRVIVFDAHGEYGPDFEDDPLVECEVAWEKEAALESLLRTHRSKPERGEQRYCLSLRVTDDDQALELWDVVWEMPDHLLVVEESSRFCGPSRLPREVARVLRFGRHRSISQLYVAQRPSAVHRDVTANADLVVAFRTSEPRDLQYLRQRAGYDVDDLRRVADFKVMVFGDVSKAPLPVIERIDERRQNRA